MNRFSVSSVAAMALMTACTSPHVTGTKTLALSTMDKVTVKGVLLNSDGVAAVDKQVFVLESPKKGTFQLASDSTGAIANQGNTDKEGRFKIKVDRAFLESRQAVLCVLLQNGITPQYPNDVPVVIKPSKGGDVIDLGRITISF